MVRTVNVSMSMCVWFEYGISVFTTLHTVIAQGRQVLLCVCLVFGRTTRVETRKVLSALPFSSLILFSFRAKACKVPAYLPSSLETSI